ncbi:nucleoside diphosphate kinase homolog 5 [Uranotaenia lowii]|uniref:nucleoside diphosphate kinase homolog 5 n=1 Tax=Uranotaenia lowii TaxID=190385 RepID=UPI00247A342D|nr:nucleoside diphosphate kinase homolog 5 [Uranotaenia lowii]
MSDYERTLLIIKPDGMKHRDTIVRRVRDAEFTVLQTRFVRLSPEQASEFYKTRQCDPCYHAMIVALTRGPIQVMCLSKVRAVEELLWLVGPESYRDAVKNAPGSLRAIFGDSRDDLRNAVHASENGEAAHFEVRFFFPTLILEPNFCEEKMNRYLEAMVNPTLMEGLYALAKERPAEPLIWLSNWLITNNPYKPSYQAPKTTTTVKIEPSKTESPMNKKPSDGSSMSQQNGGSRTDSKSDQGKERESCYCSGSDDFCPA